MSSDLKSICFRDLRTRILTLDLAPGAALDESDLSAAYGISRTPLREVMQRLAGAGYVALAPNRGAKVASMDLAAMRTFFQTAPMIYASVARMAAEHRTDRQLDDIRAIQRRFRAATETRSAGDAALENHAFHRQIGEMAANPYLLPSFERMLIDHTRLSQTFYRPESPKEEELVRTAVVQHDAMIAAFEARDREAAVELTLRHWELSQDRLERFVRPDPLPLDPAKGLRDAV